jgi:DHA1 family bicyclomycin/chloramphenicol resistance-like MFS transporter
MGIAILIAAQIGLPNSYDADTSISLKPKPIINNFLKVLQEPQFYTYAFTGSIAFSGLFSYVAASPIIFMDIFHVDAKTYGWIFAFMSLSFIGSSQLNSVLLKRFSSEQMIYGALIA